SSTKSIASIVEEYIYKDAEAGVTLIERRCPSLAKIPSLINRGSLIRQAQNQAAECRNKYPFSGCSNSTIGTVTESIAQMSVNELKHQLLACGMANIGPILPCTQRIYQRHLLRLRKYPDMAYTSKKGKEVIYPREIKSAIEEKGNPDWPSWAELEQIMCAPFKTIDPSRHWRDGNGKTCFNYLLLDPRITLELPLRSLSMSETEKMKCFISSIFYIGKGSRGRPYHHLDEEHKKKKTKKNKKYDSGAKVQRIQEIWEDGLGVVSLHVFQNTIPVEAWTREAAMISAVGLDNITNSCQGTYYGPASTWRGSRRRQFGAHLLHLALNILMFEGERQLRPNDVPLPTWMK
ncbi:unnamed protein product, partial [Meganyctiphanes norvegica]